MQLEAYRLSARKWLEAAAPIFGKAARSELTEEQDLALGRRYQRAKYEAGYAGISWPTEFGGQGRSPLDKLTFDLDERAYGMPTKYFAITFGMPLPIVMRFCEDRAWVKRRVMAALKGEEIWCQLFSEPAAGSDLAGVRLKARRVGSSWALDGQKLWTSWAHHSDYGVIVARSDPAMPKHRGLTYFWIDMHSAGVTTRRIKLAAGEGSVNEVFFDDVRVEDTQRIGAVDGGFSVAIATLMIERYAASDTGGGGPEIQALIELAATSEINGRPALQDGRIRAAIARNFAMRSGLEAILTRSLTLLAAGREPGPEGSLTKLVAARSRQRLSELAIDLRGLFGLSCDLNADPKDDWVMSWLTAPIGRIAGGADEMLLNTIAEKILGLPQDHRPDKGVPFNEIPT